MGRKQSRRFLLLYAKTGLSIMKTLYESILDNGANIIYRFISNLKQFEPKDKAEAYTYYLAIRQIVILYSIFNG